LIVDGGSTDGSSQAVEAHPNFSFSLQMERQPGSAGGIGPAYLQGFKTAAHYGADRIIQMDADGSHDPAQIPNLLKVEADLVIGSRWAPGGSISGWPISRHMLSKMANWSTRKLILPGVRDSTSGFRAMTPELVHEIARQEVTPRGFAFQVSNTLLASKLGYSICEEPIHFRDRTLGESKISINIVLESGMWLLRTTWRQIFE